MTSSITQSSNVYQSQQHFNRGTENIYYGVESHPDTSRWVLGGILRFVRLLGPMYDAQPNDSRDLVPRLRLMSVGRLNRTASCREVCRHCLPK